MTSLVVSRELLEEVLTCLNDIENRRYYGVRYGTSYELAAELSRVLRRAAQSEAT